MVKVNKEAYIPLLPYDLGYEETILQLIKSLDCLDKVVECVYEHVRGNINSQKMEIIKLNDKLNNVANKVHKLSNTKKSTQVYSGSKYPATQKDYDYSYDFNIESDIIENIKVAHQICVSREPSDKLKFYNVDDESTKLSKNIKNFQIKGLGGLPNDIKYINSLLLFNSDVNVYSNYELSSPHKVNNATTSKQVENVKNINKAAFTLPLNVTENQFDYSYTPLDEEVPSIDVPADLPDLPGIAGDIQCFREEKTNDSPVICIPSAVVDLPSFDELDDLKKNDEIVSDDLITVVQETVQLKPEELSFNEHNQNKTDHIEEINPVKIDQNVNIFNDNANTHSVLMDEIRNAGGLKKARLRSVSDRKTKDEMLPTGNGLMDDLHKKLAMRRQGISGNNKQNESGLEGVIYRMASTMLPLNAESESEEDGGDETEGDWDE